MSSLIETDRLVFVSAIIRYIGPACAKVMDIINKTLDDHHLFKEDRNVCELDAHQIATMVHDEMSVDDREELKLILQGIVSINELLQEIIVDCSRKPFYIRVDNDVVYKLLQRYSFFETNEIMKRSTSLVLDPHYFTTYMDSLLSIDIGVLPKI